MFGNSFWRASMREAFVLDAHTALAAAPYAEKAERRVSSSDRMLAGVLGNLSRRIARPLRSLRGFADEVERRSDALHHISDARLREASEKLRSALLRSGLSNHVVMEAFALTREIAGRELGMRHHPVQLMGGAVMLRGSLAEMATGEGKTITALLPAVTAALAGMPVHVITVNEYLANRDASALRPVFEAFGLTVGLVEQGQSITARRAAYACDVTYCTNKDLVFDYLRDRRSLGDRRSKARLLIDGLAGRGDGTESLFLRGLSFGIVDEADSVLIDEARTPLILSEQGPPGDGADLYRSSLELARALASGSDFVADARDRHPKLTEKGQERLSGLVEGWAGLWVSRRAREELIEQALSALHMYARDRHYIVNEGKIEIVDENTGRTMPDRSWEHGLHQLVEAKEGCEITGKKQTLARITYQRFFRRYIRLGGMTGTAAEAATEIKQTYGLDSIAIPTHRPLRRRYFGCRVFKTASDRWDTVVASAIKMSQGEERPVLIGTRSVQASEHLSSLLEAAGVRHRVLNARQDREEAEIIAGAGAPGRVTVATNMAGRGTDIRLTPEAAAAGGLHVILTEFHETARVDRQLFGRSARQGDPGSCESIVSLEDEIFLRFSAQLSHWVKALHPGRDCLPAPIGGALRAAAQRAAEWHYAKIRRQTERSDEQLTTALAFAGRGE